MYLGLSSSSEKIPWLRCYFLRTYLGLGARFEDIMASSQKPRDPAPLLALLLPVEAWRVAFPQAPSLAQWEDEVG